ncbi:N-terminal nucleophile aminohydrolase [Neolentinus lepideus HHB14362 ss-1]|uniref:N-terminal nucleophile aminohydrolase n=1 Tax=Neolentinus lepideus HHB14362 ss-1 TaxID=1314782 RepID=A0A165THN8_9AGAM|nr:N-terminal nucleophile aminohydrolase [Neolentinus lepideus HHB14362 ss-1]
MDSFFLVAVHGGAGYHNPSDEKEVKKALCLACTAALARLQVDSTAVDAVEAAISSLEDDDCLNAGYGSNLTIDGEVECDAAIMDGRDLSFGSVGAVPDLKNPIRAAHAVMKYSKQLDPLGRIPPLTLTSLGARRFASSKGCEVVSPGTLVSPRARRQWQTWTERLEHIMQGNAVSSDGSQAIHDKQDTVGAITLDAAGHLAAGVSSGGLLLKFSGRIGEAAAFGAGCWAQDNSTDPIANGMACSISGSGEYIIRSNMAQSLWHEYHNSSDGDAHRVLERVLTESRYNGRGDRNTEWNAGILMLTMEANGSGAPPTPRLWCGFTAESMAIAYATSINTKPKVKILRRSIAAEAGITSSSISISAISLSRD